MDGWMIRKNHSSLPTTPSTITTMGCASSKPKADATTTIPRPHVTRAPTSTPVDAKDHLPPGAILTGAARLRAMGLRGQGVKVAVIDSGIDAEHQGFDGKVVGKTWYREGTPLSEDDHGTHVAGTIHFLAPDAALYDYRVFGAAGKLGVTAAIAQSIRDAVDKDGCHVINMSLGGPAPSPAIKEAVQYAHSKGVLLVCAAGNSGDDNILTNEISWPASFPQCLSIAAVQKRHGLPVAVFSNSNAQVDYAGIGVDVVSLKPGGGYQTMSGTSMACPHVCGLIAAILSNGRIVNKGAATDRIVREALNDAYVVDIGVEGRDNATGLGFLTALDESGFNKAMKEIGTSMAVVH